MTSDLHLSGPTVTLFGQRDALDEALSDELGRRGCSTHVVTTPMGWLGSVGHAVVRLDTPTGDQALTDLSLRNAPAAHIVAVCENTVGEATSMRLEQLCRQCSQHHDLSLIWHAPLALGLDDAPDGVVPGDLAVTIADEIGHQEAWTSAPSFVSQTFEAHRHRGHG